MLKRIPVILSILFIVVFAPPVVASDNGAASGTKKVESGFKAVGKSAEEIGGKAARATEGAAKDTGSALGRAWDNIVQGVKKAFK